MAVPAVAAVTLGAEVLQLLLKIASTEEGVAWIGRRMKGELPALRARVRKNKHVKVGGRDV